MKKSANVYHISVCEINSSRVTGVFESIALCLFSNTEMNQVCLVLTKLQLVIYTGCQVTARWFFMRTK